MPTTHQRKVIRDAVVAALVGIAPTYATSAQERVKTSRKWPWKVRQLPASTVYMLPEDVDVKESKKTAPRELQRMVTMVVESHVLKGNFGSVDDAGDAIALEIEKVMHRDPTFGGACAGSILKRTEVDSREEDEETIFMIGLAYEVDYQTPAPYDEDAVPDDLVTVDIKTNLAGAQEPANQMEDVADHLDQ